MLVLGLSGNFSGEDVDLVPNMSRNFFHDAAACLIRDGELLAAVEEERFNRIKKTTKFPINAINACLGTSGVSAREIDAVGHYFQEDSVDTMLNSIYTRNPQVPVRASRELMMGWLRDELHLNVPDERLLYVEHHVAHAMSCFLRSGMEEALVVVMDGAGDNHSTTVYRGSQGGLETLATYGLGKSLGSFYGRGIRLLGYELGDEYKVMGLAPYGNPDTYGELFESLYALKDHGDFDLNFSFRKFYQTGMQPRRKGEEFTQQHKDIAASLQQTLEKVAMHLMGYWAEYTGIPDLCFVGGVAHNSSLNGLLLRSGKFRKVFIHPVSHDGGAAEGAALTAAHQLEASWFRQPQMRSASVGPDLGTAADIEKEIASWSDLIEYEKPADIVQDAARLLADGAVLGWAHGRSEYGPRALGNRSILADSRPPENKQRINAMVKKREAYRPFAPVVTAEAASAYFDLPQTQANYDFMSFVVNVREERKAELGAVTHVDGTARLQIIDPASNERFHRLVQRFGQLTGTPVLLNTSFNNNAEPIVQSVHDAITCFLTTGLDFLAIEDFLIRRRPGRSLAFEGLVVQFLPVTRLAKRLRITMAGAREVVHEISLQYNGGPKAQISPDAFSLLEGVDGVRTLESLAGAMGGLTEDIKRELYDLWQQRFFALRPSGGTFASPVSPVPPATR
jgi:predicted NodU family carbamoyl transferase